MILHISIATIRWSCFNNSCVYPAPGEIRRKIYSSANSENGSIGRERIVFQYKAAMKLKHFYLIATNVLLAITLVCYLKSGLFSPYIHKIKPLLQYPRHSSASLQSTTPEAGGSHPTAHQINGHYSADSSYYQSK